MTLFGTVVDAVDGTYLAGATITAMDNAGNETGQVFQANGLGSFVTEYSAPWFRITHVGYLPLKVPAIFFGSLTAGFAAKLQRAESTLPEVAVTATTAKAKQSSLWLLALVAVGAYTKYKKMW